MYILLWDEQMLDVLSYAAALVPEITDSPADVDAALEVVQPVGDVGTEHGVLHMRDIGKLDQAIDHAQAQGDQRQADPGDDLGQVFDVPDREIAPSARLTARSPMSWIGVNAQSCAHPEKAILNLRGKL